MFSWQAATQLFIDVLPDWLKWFSDHHMLCTTAALTRRGGLLHNNEKLNLDFPRIMPFAVMQYSMQRNGLIRSTDASLIRSLEASIKELQEVANNLEIQGESHTVSHTLT